MYFSASELTSLREQLTLKQEYICTHSEMLLLKLLASNQETPVSSKICTNTTFTVSLLYYSTISELRGLST